MKEHIDKRIAVRQMDLPKGMDIEAVILIMDQGLSFEGYNLKTWSKNSR